jgi:hypothetical protein
MPASALTTSLRAGAAACAVAAALAIPGGATASPVRPAPARHGYGVEAVHRFLVGFYGQHGPSRSARGHDVAAPLRARAARTTGYDLLLCAQNTPRAIDVGRVTTTPSGTGDARAVVTTHFAGQRSSSSFAAYVGLDADRPMRLTDVVCPK